MEQRFIFSGEGRVRPQREIFAQVRTPYISADYVLTVRDISDGGTLLDLGDLEPPWLIEEREVEITLVAEGEARGAEFRGSVRRIQDGNGSRALAICFAEAPRRSRKYLARVLRDGTSTRQPTEHYEC